MQRCRASCPFGNLPTAAEGVNETDGRVRRSVSAVDGETMSRHRLADHHRPAFPLAWGLGLVVGVQ